MKMLGRVLVIVTAFTLVMGLVYFAVNASGTSTNAPAFERGRREFSSEGARPEFRGEDHAGGGLFFGLLKNTVIVAVIVMLITIPKNLLRQKRRAVPVRIN